MTDWEAFEASVEADLAASDMADVWLVADDGRQFWAGEVKCKYVGDLTWQSTDPIEDCSVDSSAQIIGFRVVFRGDRVFIRSSNVWNVGPSDHLRIYSMEWNGTP